MKRVLRNREYSPSIISFDEDEDNKEEIKKLKIKDEIKEKAEKKTVRRGKNVEVKGESKQKVKKEDTDNDEKEEEVTKRVKAKNVKRKNEDKLQTSSKKKVKLGEDIADTKDFNENLSIKLKNVENHSTVCQEWTDVDYISEVSNIDKHVAENVVKLFKEDNTIPFIARYRRNMTGGMEPDQLRSVKKCFDQAKIIKHRAATIIKAIDKLGKWTPQIHSTIVSTKSIDDLEYIYSMFKVGSKQSLAEKARLLGLGPVSNAVLEGKEIPPLSSLINPDETDLQTEQQVKEGIIHIIADSITKNKDTFEKVKVLQNISIIEIHTTQVKASVSKDEKKNINEPKYETYFNFKSNTRIIKPHQVLAINRAEAQKVLKVKIDIPDSLAERFKTHCLRSFRFLARCVPF